MTYPKRKKQPEPETPFQLAEIQVSYKPKVKASDRPQVTCSRDAHEIFKSAWADDINMVERFYIMLLNQANRVLGIKCLSVGGITGTVADQRVAMAIAMKGNATGMLMAHNHPSSAKKPSRSDIELTSKFVETGKVVGIDVRDHIIENGEDDYYSFADEGLMP